MTDNPERVVGSISSFEKTDTHYAIEFQTGEKANLHILNDHVFRYYMSPSGVFLDYPTPINPDDVAKIVAKDINDYGYEAFKQSIRKYTTTHITLYEPKM